MSFNNPLITETIWREAYHDTIEHGPGIENNAPKGFSDVWSTNFRGIHFEEKKCPHDSSVRFWQTIRFDEPYIWVSFPKWLSANIPWGCRISIAGPCYTSTHAIYLNLAELNIHTNVSLHQFKQVMFCIKGAHNHWYQCAAFEKVYHEANPYFTRKFIKL